MSVEKAIEMYKTGGMVPWTKGYGEYKDQQFDLALADWKLQEMFRSGDQLPAKFAYRVDERVCEYSWIFAKMNPDANCILDAGSCFSKEAMVNNRFLKDKRIIIYTLDTDWMGLDPRISYIFGDFREMVLRDKSVDVISCISTLEHVGMGQDYRIYNISNHASHQDVFAYREVLSEFGRVLTPGGQLLITMPYGKRENHGWLFQNDEESLKDVIRSFPGELVTMQFYRYHNDQWQSATAEECAECTYFNLHASNCYDEDYAAAARSIVCLEFRRNKSYGLENYGR